MAVEYDYIDVVDYLIRKGADIDAKNAEGHRAITGIEGSKDGKSDLFVFLSASNSRELTKERLAKAIDGIAREPEKVSDKSELASAGLRIKKQKKELWDDSVQEKFKSMLQS